MLYCFLEGIILDLPTIIQHEMIKIKEIDRRALGFGALLTDQIFERSRIDLSTEVSIPCQGPIDKYMIERSRVLDLLAERVIEGGLDALTPHHLEADVPTDAPQDDDVPIIDAQPIRTPSASAFVSTSAPGPSLPDAFYSSFGDFQHRTSDRLKEMGRMLNSLENSFRFSSIDNRIVDLRLQRLEQDQITVLDELKETRWELKEARDELKEIRNEHRETRALLDTILAHLPPPPPLSFS